MNEFEHPQHTHAVSRWLSRAFAVLCMALALPVGAIQAPEPGQEPGHRLTRAFVAPELKIESDLEASTTFGEGRTVPPKTGLAAFEQRHGGQWELRWDRRTDRPNLIQGSGIALLPGRGNRLTAAEVGLAPGASVELDTVVARLQDFIDAHADLLRTDGLEFRLDPAASAAYGAASTHWFVEFAQYANGVRVDRAKLFFRIAHGNIVQFGSELVAPVLVDTRPAMTREAAFAEAWRELGFLPGTTLVETREAGELLVLPVLPGGEPPGFTWNGAAGAGYAHRLAWRFVFRVADDDATYEVLFDAHAGSVIEVRNQTVNVAAQVTGGIYPTTNSDLEIVVPMPYATVSNGGTRITDVLGMYDYSGGTATVTLGGRYFSMSDNCGSISLSNSTDGNLALGTSGGTDCTTPGVGGPGNTHASRTGFYHLTNINRKAVTFHPGNSWLASTVTANMNVNQTCNASWDGTSLNFYKSGGGCSNTGEIAAVFLHEWGHGMDTNTGGSASDMGSGEAVGDTFAFLETRDACIGRNFKPGVPCYNCDASCTGVRDLEAFSTRGAAVIARPDTMGTVGGPNCARFDCPYYSGGFFPYQGPMGYEGHCESYIAGSANWDLTQALIDHYGAEQGWEEMDRIWYGSLIPSKAAYRVVSGGTCNVNATVDGCGSDNWYTALIAADDDDGNLANGTPNGCRIWDAFEAHGIACGTRPVCNADAPDFRLTVAAPSQASCVPGAASYGIAVESQMGYVDPVTLSATGLPAGVSAVFTPNPVIPGNTATLVLTADAGAASGSSTVTVSGTGAGSPGHTVDLTLTLSAGVPGTPALALPAQGATGVARQPVFTWAAEPAALAYTIEIASDAGFAAVVATGHPTAASYTPASTLQPLTTYYWRVRAESPCGNSAWSAVRSFTTGVTFPEPYCPVTFPSGVEPITLVQFAGIDNASSPTVNGSPPLEDFTGVIGSLMPGDSLPMTVKGNTAGSYTNYITAYVDWNRNGVFTDPGEKYDIGTITASTGVDGKQATASIAVPAGAALGTTRLRVMKRWNAEGTPCNGSGYGQAEDYTLQVGSLAQWKVGGSVTGLRGPGLVLTLNGATDLPLNRNGGFSFPELLADGDAYEVTVGAQPGAPAQTCAVAHGAGTIASAHVTDVEVACVTDVIDSIFVDGFDAEP